jgi:3-oxoadipate enol-lactonase
VQVHLKTARLPTRSVRYLEVGTGAALVLLHAFPLSADQWLPQLSRVPRGWRVVAPDFRGFGGQALAPAADGAAIGMDTYAADTFELMSHLEIDRAVVCGLSMGGYVAFAMVRRAAERVTGLVFADTRAAADTDEGRAGRDRMLEVLEQDGLTGVASAIVPKLLGAATRREQPDLADAVTRLIESNRADGIAAAIRALKDRPDSTGLLSSISCPTTILCGDEDVLTPPADSEAMHRAIRHSRLVILPRAGHLSNLENPLGFNDALFAY